MHRAPRRRGIMFIHAIATAGRRVRGFSAIASISVLEAARMVKAGSHYLDCRAESEFVDASVAASSVENCSFPHNDAGDVTNEAFLAECADAFDRSDSIVVVRRSFLSPALSLACFRARALLLFISPLPHLKGACPRAIFLGLQGRSSLAHGGRSAGCRRLH